MKFFKEIQQPLAEASRPDAYQRDEINATSGFGKNSYAYQMDGGANDEDHEGDRRREQQVQSGTWYVRINGKIVKDKAGQPYTFRGKAAANKAALTMQAKPFNQGKEIMLTTNPNDKVAEAETQPSMYYSEELAQKVFDQNPNLDATGKADAVLDAGWPIAVADLGKKSAQHKFAYDEDFPSDFVSMYHQLQQQSQQGVTEGANVDSLVTDALKIMKGPELSHAVDALKTVLGDREYNSRRGFYNFYIKQIVDMYNKQGVAEGVQDSLSLQDAAKVLKQYGATNLKTTSNELHFYKDGRPFSVDLIWNGDIRNVSLSQLNAATRGLKGQGVAEGYGDEDNPVASAITRRILMQRHDLLQKYGPAKVTQAIDDVVDYYDLGPDEEIGSSDVSNWVKQVERSLASMGEGIEEDTIAQMRDYFNQDHDSVDVSRDYGDPVRKEPPVGIPPEIQALVNKMYHNGKITQQEFQILKNFQKKTKINVGIKEADMSTGNQGYDSMLAVMKAVDAGHDATFNLGGEPITLDYNEARFLAGRYKAFLKAGRQEEFLKYMESPVAFDRLMKQLRDLMDKQKNFKGSVEGERGVEEGVVDTIKSGAKKAFKALTGPDDEELIQRLEKETGGKRPEKKDMPQVKENEYYCGLDNTVKEIPEGYKRTADGYITRIQG